MGACMYVCRRHHIMSPWPDQRKGKQQHRTMLTHVVANMQKTAAEHYQENARQRACSTVSSCTILLTCICTLNVTGILGTCVLWHAGMACSCAFALVSCLWMMLTTLLTQCVGLMAALEQQRRVYPTHLCKVHRKMSSAASQCLSCFLCLG